MVVLNVLGESDHFVVVTFNLLGVLVIIPQLKRLVLFELGCSAPNIIWKQGREQAHMKGSKVLNN